MSWQRRAARDAVSNWFAPPAVDNLRIVKRSFPNDWDARDFTNEGVPFGGVAAVFIPTTRQSRIAYGGPQSGVKRFDHHVELHVFFHALSPMTMEEAMDHYDDLFDSLDDRLRADRTLGSPLVWQAGESQTDDVVARHGEPAMAGDTVVIWGALEFTLTMMQTT